MTLANPDGPGPRRSSAMDDFASPLKLLPNMSTEMKIVLAIFAVLALWGGAIAVFGLPAFVWPMKVIVPSLILALVIMTWGQI